MPTIDAGALDADQLAPMLRAWAAGFYPSEAAVELLIAHGTWLRRRDFRTLMVDAVDDGWTRTGTEPLASVNWDGIAAFLEREDVVGSSSEFTVLRLAASLAGARTPDSLMALTGGLDDTNAGYVLDALAHRFGWHERGTTRNVTGDLYSSAGSR